MEGRCVSDDSSETLSIPRSDLKTNCKKRSNNDFGEKNAESRKKVKLRDLESVCRSEATNTHHSNILEKKAAKSEEFQFGEEEMYQVSEVPVIVALDASQAEKSGKVDPTVRPLDLNIQACIPKDSTCLPSPRGIDLDLNAEVASSSPIVDSLSQFKSQHNLKSRDISECASSTGPLEEKDPLKIWKEMKQNGFLSSSHGGVPMPKQPRGKKNITDVYKKKMELAKREEVDRFTKVVGPSGLLNDLNPGIINHVRNRKQVLSIIEAIVRSEKREKGQLGSKHTTDMRSETKEPSNMMDLGNMNDSDRYELSSVRGYGPFNTRDPPMSMNRSLILEGKSGESAPIVLEGVKGKTFASCSASYTDEDALKLSSSGKVSGDTAPVYNEESENLTGVSSLSYKAATVASQWLELLHQDIKGRLSALRRSKKRVRAVITTELPFLISKENSCNRETDPHFLKYSSDGDLHHARWTTLFDQMDKALSQEEKQLESWSDQVKEMQLYCEQGLHQVQHCPVYHSKHLEAPEYESQSRKMDSLERELAVEAAAGSIYSTCKFLLSDNVPCS